MASSGLRRSEAPRHAKRPGPWGHPRRAGPAGRGRYPHAGPPREGRPVAEQREARSDDDTGGSAGAVDRAGAAVRVRAGHAGRLRGARVQERPAHAGRAVRREPQRPAVLRLRRRALQLRGGLRGGLPHRAAAGRPLRDRRGRPRRDLDAQLPRVGHVLHGRDVDRRDRRRPQRAVAARGDGVRADRQRGHGAVRGRRAPAAAGRLLGRRVGGGDRRPARGWAEVRRRGARRLAARRARGTDAAVPRRADRRRDDPLHVGLGGISEGRGEHAPERHHRAAVVGAGQRGGPDRRRPGMAQAGPSAGDAAGRAALPRHRFACGVPVVVPGAAQDRLDVQVGPGARRGLDRAGAHRHVRRGAGDDGGPGADRADDVARPEFADDGGWGRGAAGARAGEGDRSVVRERLRGRAGG